MCKSVVMDLSSGAAQTLTLALLITAGGFSSAWAAGSPHCTKTSTSCYDTVSKKARTCVTTLCTYADGHSTTSVSVEFKLPVTTGKPKVDTGKVGSKIQTQ